jgi:PAS domain S-box-containing protein
LVPPVGRFDIEDSRDWFALMAFLAIGIFASHLSDLARREALHAKRAEEAARRSEAYLAEAQRLTSTGSWALNVETRKLYWSAEMFRIWGFDPKQGPPDAERARQRIHPADREWMHADFQMALEGGLTREVVQDHRIVLPDGTVKHIRGIGHPVLDATGRVVEYFGTTVDVTERKQAEQQRERLQQLQADLARVNRVTTMGELAASVAHEVNQPIAAAVADATTCLRWLIRDAPDLDEARAAAQRAVKGATRVAEIISRIRRLFKKSDPEYARMDVNELITEIVALLRGEAMRYRVSTCTELDAALPWVMGDRIQLQQVLVNLMMNSIDAMKDIDGERAITITSRCDDGHHLLVSVADTGVGLPPDTDQIFIPFVTTKVDGTGMGLAISRSIIESHGGRLWATTNADRGATFSFRLPILAAT